MLEVGAGTGGSTLVASSPGRSVTLGIRVVSSASLGGGAAGIDP